MNSPVLGFQDQMKSQEYLINIRTTESFQDVASLSSGATALLPAATICLCSASVPFSSPSFQGILEAAYIVAYHSLSASG